MRYLLIGLLFSSVAYGQAVQSLKRKADGSVEARFKDGGTSEFVIEGNPVKSSSGSTAFTIDTSSNQDSPKIEFYRGGVVEAVVGVASGNDTLVTGSTAGDTVIRSEGFGRNVQIAGGAAGTIIKHATIDGNGNFIVHDGYISGNINAQSQNDYTSMALHADSDAPVGQSSSLYFTTRRVTSGTDPGYASIDAWETGFGEGTILQLQMNSKGTVVLGGGSGFATFPLIINSSAANGGHNLWRFYEDSDGDGHIQVLDAAAVADVIISADSTGSYFENQVRFGTKVRGDFTTITTSGPLVGAPFVARATPAIAITAITGGAEGAIVHIISNGAPPFDSGDNFTLVQEDGSSTSTDRIQTGTGANRACRAAILIYNNAAGRWYTVSCE